MDLCAERIRQSLAEHPYELGNGETGKLSGSIGFVLYPFARGVSGLMRWETVAALADQAAYIAKANQRNAWVGIYSRVNETTASALEGIRDEFEDLLQRGLVEIRTSISGDTRKFKLNPENSGR